MRPLSVVIPVAPTRLENLRLVLTSLVWQTFKAFEVIIVNDGGRDDIWAMASTFCDRLDLRYIWSPKFVPGKDIQPRNKGARLARHEFLVFADSDVMLRSDVLGLYSEDLTADPDRIVAGIYHWLRPMQITPEDVAVRFDDIIEERLAPLPLEEPQTHNICREIRLQTFLETEPHVRHHSQAAALACFSGNICWPKTIFWDIGGYWNELSAGLVEDGASGMAAYYAGHSVSLDKRIIGGHIYHHRNHKYAVRQSVIEVEKMERLFHMGPFADGKPAESYKERQTW